MSEKQTDIAGQEVDLPAMIPPTAELVEQAWTAIMDGSLPPEVGDPSVTARMIKERIRHGSFEEALAPQQGLPAWSEEYLDEPVTVYAFHLNPSAFVNAETGEKGGAYAVCEIGLPETGDLVTVSIGGGNVLAQLVKAWETNNFPFNATLKSKPTGTPGRTVLWLEKS